MIENILSSYLDITKEEKMPPGKKKTLEAAIKLFANKGIMEHQLCRLQSCRSKSGNCV